MLCMPFIMLILGSFPFVESWSLIKICNMSFNCVSFHLDWNDTIRSRWYFESWLDTSYICILFIVSSKWYICDPSVYSSSFPYPRHMTGDIFFWISIPNSISVSDSLLHIMKLWVNLKSTILRWSAVIPNAVIGDPSAVFNLVMVACIGVLKLLSIVCYVEYLMSDMAAPESINSLIAFSCMYCYYWTICDECHCNLVIWR